MLPTEMTPKRPRPKKAAVPRRSRPSRAVAPPPPTLPPPAPIPPPPLAGAPNGDLAPDVSPTFGDIPWGYGDTRMTAMARDPNWIFVYWEMTDESIAEARARFGDPNAGFALRVYDTTHRIFNGLNAHLHWDIPVDRATYSYYVRVGRPAATFHVDIGVTGWGGSFVPIARSGAVTTPRDSVSPDTRTEWSTILRSGPGFSYRHRYTPRPGGPAPAAGVAESSDPGELQSVFEQFAGEGWTRSEWLETQMDGRVVRWIRWVGPHLPERPAFSSAGIFRQVEILFQGERRVVRYEEGERFVFGPWKIVLEAVGPGGERRTIDRWTLRSRWVTEEGTARVETPEILMKILGGRNAAVLMVGSERRLAKEEWGSEFLQRGASEWRWIGASENMLQGASESLMQGGTETLFLGATEIQALGGSEQGRLGSSESVGGSSDGGRP